ncbi:CHAT domain-containing protein [bacterium]|nr:MAG: CHAT domain-containing protein [bacterium]
METRLATVVGELAAGTTSVSRLPKSLRTGETFDAVVAEGMARMRVDLSQAARLAKAAATLARGLKDPRYAGSASRLAGHIQLLSGDHRKALELYTIARERFSAADMGEEAAITASAAIQAYIYDDRYEEAFALADEAAAVFRETGNDFRLARLQVNVANALHRLDRMEEALPRYEASLAALQAAGAHEDAAIVMHNAAVCLMALHRFDDAEALYLSARVYFETNGLRGLALESDRNRAYLLGRQGRFREALSLYREADRTDHLTADEAADPVLANGLLDQSEFLLEIGLHSEALTVLERASKAFQTLDMIFEQGKTAYMRAIAAGLADDFDRAAGFLSEARGLLQQVPNPVWQALVHLVHGQLRQRAGQPERAIRPLERALAALAKTQARERLADTLLALSEARLNLGDADGSADAAERAVAADSTSGTQFQRAWLLSRSAEMRSDPIAARAYLATATERYEAVRSELGPAALRQAFQTGRAEIYEDAFRLAQSSQERYAAIQRAKSRTLLEMVASPEATVNDPETRSLRKRLNFVQHAIRIQEGVAEVPNPEPIEDLRAVQREIEERLLVAEKMGALDERAVPRLDDVPDLSDVRRELDEETVLLEFFTAGDEIVALAIGRDWEEERPLGRASDIATRSRFLRFQIYRGLNDPQGQTAVKEAEGHLANLGSALLAPFADRLRGRRAVLMPHGALHRMPLHACLIEGEPLCLMADTSYAPSIAVWSRLGVRGFAAAGPGLVFGTGDELALRIEPEAALIAENLRTDQVFLGKRATMARLAAEGGSHRFVHIGSHGLFREDQPLFSSVRIGKDEVCALDVAKLRLGAELVTLSGCSTAVSDVSSGDEQTGLINAFLVAGARTVLASQWDTDDASAERFMVGFYRGISAGSPLPAAYRESVAALRADRPHPAHWAPFALFGYV